MTPFGGQKLGGRGARPGGSHLRASYYNRLTAASLAEACNSVSKPVSQSVSQVASGPPVCLPRRRRRPTYLGSPEHPESCVGMRLKIADRGGGVHVRV